MMRLVAAAGLLLAATATLAAEEPPPGRTPTLRTVDLDVGETSRVGLADGSTAEVRLLGLEETRDPIQGAIREARVRVAINGREIELTSGNDRLPREVARVQVVCPVTGGYRVRSSGPRRARESARGPGHRPPVRARGRVR